jgi:hypothetical protein
MVNGNAEERLISPDPVIVLAIRNRKNLLISRGIVRRRSLDFAEAVGRTLRSFDFWVSLTAGGVAGRIRNRILP